MTLDIEKIKAAATAANESVSGGDMAWFEFGKTANPQAVFELITRLEAAEKDAAKWHEYQAKKKVLADRGFGKSPMRDMKESV